MIEDLEQRLGPVRARFLTNRFANLPCPVGMVVKDLAVDDLTAQDLRAWFNDLRLGTVIGGNGRGLYVQGPTPLRNVAAGAIVTTAVGVTPLFATMVASAIPVRALSTTAYLDAVKTSYDGDDEASDLVRACKASFTGRAGETHNVRLLVLMDLGAEPRKDVSDFPREELRALLSLRLEHGMPTIITSRLASGDLPKTYKEDFQEVIDAAFTGVPLEATE